MNGYVLRYVDGDRLTHWIINGIAVCGRVPDDADEGGWRGGWPRYDLDPKVLPVCLPCARTAEEAPDG